MAFVTFDEYQTMYPNSDLTSGLFDVYERQAERVLDALTTGVDNVHKLYDYFPTKERDVQAVQDATIHITNLLYEISKAESAYALSVGADGLATSSVVASRSSGSESISYSQNKTAISEAVTSFEAKQNILNRTARFYLAGGEDKNGVNLLYMGVYPYVY